GGQQRAGLPGGRAAGEVLEVERGVAQQRDEGRLLVPRRGGRAQEVADGGGIGAAARELVVERRHRDRVGLEAVVHAPPRGQLVRRLAEPVVEDHQVVSVSRRA